MKSGQQNNHHAQRLANTSGAVHHMILIGTADSLIELRARNEQRLAIAKQQRQGQQVYRHEQND
jgi:hypothetical protein